MQVFAVVVVVVVVVVVAVVVVAAAAAVVVVVAAAAVSSHFGLWPHHIPVWLVSLLPDPLDQPVPAWQSQQ